MQCVLLLLHCVACCPAWACYTKQKKQTFVVIMSLVETGCQKDMTKAVRALSTIIQT